MSVQWQRSYRTACDKSRCLMTEILTIKINKFKMLNLKSGLIPVLKMRSHAAVWSCHVLVLKLLWSSTGVTIIIPKVLIICGEHDTTEETTEGLITRLTPGYHLISFLLPPWTLWPQETFVSLHLSSPDSGWYWFAPVNPSKYKSVRRWTAASPAAVQRDEPGEPVGVSQRPPLKIV